MQYARQLARGREIERDMEMRLSVERSSVLLLYRRKKTGDLVNWREVKNGGRFGKSMWEGARLCLIIAGRLQEARAQCSACEPVRWCENGSDD